MALVACPDENDDKQDNQPTAVMSFVASTTPPTTPVSIAENGGESTVTLTVNRAIPMGGSDLTFPYTITGIDASDITADSLTGSITVAAGSATGTLTITAVDNSMTESDKTMTITLDALPSGITATGIDPVEIIITDDETPPASVRSFVASTTPPTSPVSIAENGGVATVTLTLDRAIPVGDSALVFPYTITGIDASDITADSLTGSIAVAAGSATGTLTITAMDDDVDEGDKTMTITLGTLPSGITATGIDPVEITIIDDETPPASVRSFVASTTPPTGPVSIAENGGVATLTLTLDRAIPAGDSALVFPLEEITGIQAGDIDGSLSGRSITVSVGSAIGTLTITAVDNSMTEGDKTMTVTLGTLPSGITATGIDPVEITITDDESPPASVRSFVASTTPPTGPASIAEDGGVATLTLTLDRAIQTGDSALVFPLEEITGIQAGDIDGSLSGRSITVAPGSATGTLVITAMDDDVDEGASETMTITLGALPSGITATGIGPVEITITDDDDPPTQVTGFAITSGVLPIAEDGSDSVTITLTLNSRIPAGESALVFPYILAGADIQATDITVGGNNITSLTNGTISVAEGSNTATLVIAGRQDTTDEGVRETLTVTLGTLPNNSAGTPLTDASGVTNIMIRIDDDDGLTARLTRSPADGQLTEGEDNGVFTLAITGVERATSFALITGAATLTGTNAAASDIAIVLGGDADSMLLPLNGNLLRSNFVSSPTFNAGSDQAITITYTIDPNEDDGDTTPETVTIALTDITVSDIGIIASGAITGPGVVNGALTFIINDND